MTRELRIDAASLVSVLQSICEADKTPAYAAGEPTPAGELPGAGKAWHTPRQLAERALADMARA